PNATQARISTMAGLSAGWRCSTEGMRWPAVGGRLSRSSAVAVAAAPSIEMVTAIPFDADRSARVLLVRPAVGSGFTGPSLAAFRGAGHGPRHPRGAPGGGARGV